VLSEEKLYKIRAGLEQTPQKSLRRLVQETDISKSSAAKAMKLLKLLPCRATVVHALQPRDPASRINFCNWFLQSVHDGDDDPHLTFSSDKAWFNLQGNILSENNRHWISIHEVPLHNAIFTRLNGTESVVVYRDIIFSSSYNIGKLILLLIRSDT
jgi:hypothetical protein